MKIVPKPRTRYYWRGVEVWADNGQLQQDCTRANGESAMRVIFSYGS
jgi:hypothetical protein